MFTDEELERKWERIWEFSNRLQGRFYFPLIELSGGLKAKFDEILACPYEDLRQDLSDILDAMITERWQRALQSDEHRQDEDWQKEHILELEQCAKAAIAER